MLSLRVKVEGKKDKEGWVREYSGWSSCIFLFFFFLSVFPLIRKALCKSSFSEIRGSKKDCRVECYNLLPQRLVSSDRKPRG